jgi:hypothetical protein
MLPTFFGLLLPLLRLCIDLYKNGRGFILGDFQQTLLHPECNQLFSSRHGAIITSSSIPLTLLRKTKSNTLMGM